jgi:hypothetical protein
VLIANPLADQLIEVSLRQANAISLRSIETKRGSGSDCRDDDDVEDSCLTLDRPEHAALNQARGDGIELVPALQTTVGREHGLE